MARPSTGQSVCVAGGSLEQARAIRRMAGVEVERAHDPWARHIVVRNGDEFIGTASFVQTRDGVFVYGVGAAQPGFGVVQRVLAHADDAGWQPLLLHATSDTVDLYRRSGFVTKGKRRSLVGDHLVTEMVRSSAALELNLGR